jgi:hypothetical protein
MGHSKMAIFNGLMLFIMACTLSTTSLPKFPMLLLQQRLDSRMGQFQLDDDDMYSFDDSREPNCFTKFDGSTLIDDSGSVVQPTKQARQNIQMMKMTMKMTKTIWHSCSRTMSIYPNTTFGG